MMENTIEQGKIMRLHGLSTTQWNGCIVEVSKTDKETLRYSCEVIVGRYKGRKLAIKVANLEEVPRPPSYTIFLAMSRFSVLSCILKSLQIDDSGSGSSENMAIDEILQAAMALLLIVPNCAALWKLLYQICKWLLVFITIWQLLLEYPCDL